MQPRVVAAGDSAWLIELEDRLDPDVNARAIAIAAAVEARRPPAVTDIAVGYRSVMIYVDPLEASAEGFDRWLEALLGDVPASPAASSRAISIPVCYGGSFGPDLPDVARFASLTADEVIARHAALEYRVYMVGFVPGFAYLAAVDPVIAAPRRANPRVRVPRGSVAIAGGQTGIYPAETPGGWNVIGRTPVRPYDQRRGEPFLLRAGDRVRFHPIDRAEYRASSEWGDG
jgi:inhibitor of KinA